MQELIGVLWVCTRCRKVFTGPFDGDVGMLPCGHHFGIAAATEEVIRSMRIADVVQAENFAEDMDTADFVFRLECLVNE